MEHTEEAFLNHVKEVFEYELPYKEGSWEKFQQQHRKKERAIWFSWTVKVAAILFFSILLWLWRIPVPVKTNIDVLTVTKPAERRYLIQKDNISVLKAKPISVPKKLISSTIDWVLSSDSGIVIQTTVTDSNIVQVTNPHRNVLTQNSPARTSAAVTKWTDLPASTKKMETDHAGEWKISPLLATTYGTSGNLRLGFGATVTYALNNRFAINTGAAFNQLSALHKTNDISIMEGEGKKLQSVQTAISGLDIPIELKYKLNAHNYISMGVSAMGILKQSQALNYSELKMIKVSVDGDDGVISENRLVAVEESVAVSGEELPKQNYIGFYNFSYGISRNIGKQVFIIEPFIKLPMKTYSDRRTNLTSGGIKLKFEF